HACDRLKCARFLIPPHHPALDRRPERAALEASAPPAPFARSTSSSTTWPVISRQILSIIPLRYQTPPAPATRQPRPPDADIEGPAHLVGGPPLRSSGVRRCTESNSQGARGERPRASAPRSPPSRSPQSRGTTGERGRGDAGAQSRERSA